MGSDFHDQVSIEGGADPLQQGDCGYNAACFQAGQGWLRHARPGGEFDLRQAQSKSALADGLADQESTASLATAVALGADRFITNNQHDFPAIITETRTTYHAHLPGPAA